MLEATPSQIGPSQNELTTNPMAVMAVPSSHKTAACFIGPETGSTHTLLHLRTRAPHACTFPGPWVQDVFAAREHCQTKHGFRLNVWVKQNMGETKDWGFIDCR